MTYTKDEIMTAVASRYLENGKVCFVGIGLPSVAVNLAKKMHAPDLVLIYESGTIDTKPEVLPLSIGDDELAEKAGCLVSVPEMFQYWLQGGNIDVGFLGAAQIDKFANINTSVIGDYNKPKVRLPGGGGAPEIASCCGKILIVLRQGHRTFVDKLDFVTSLGHGTGGSCRKDHGLSTLGPTTIITDMGILETEQGSNEFIMTHLHPGVTREEAGKATGWDLRFAETVEETPEPNSQELEILRDLQERTKKAHAGTFKELNNIA